tara:strand:- start:678 stop:1295 length:618 start_codon:yes stop_codon:yes gene_type:complete
MARHLTVASVIETHNIASEAAYIILIECDIIQDGSVAETIRICNNTENLTYDGEEYVAASFTMDVKQENGEEPGVTLASFDPTGVLRQRIEEFNGGVGFPVRMMVVNANNLDNPAEITEEFIITGASAQGYGISLTLGAENPLRMRFPLRVMFRNRCSFKYKGPRCKYAGAMGSCDYTFDGANGCQAHGNEANFGGFRGLKNLNV